MNRRALMFAPLALVTAAGGGFYAMLRGTARGTFDTHAVPTMLLGRPVPPFSLPGLSASELGHGALLVHFFASWCAPCIEESAVMMSLRRAGLPIAGIAWRDRVADTDAFLSRHGDPFARRAADLDGRVAIDWGVTGVPETYLVRDGIVRARWVAPLTPELAERAVLPMARA